MLPPPPLTVPDVQISRIRFFTGEFRSQRCNGGRSGLLVEGDASQGIPQSLQVRRGHHGPKRYLSISTPGQRPQIDYVPNDAFSKVTEYLDNYRNVREALNEICAINTELLRRREELD